MQPEKWGNCLGSRNPVWPSIFCRVVPTWLRCLGPAQGEQGVVNGDRWHHQPHPLIHSLTGIFGASPTRQALF